jgi:DNA-3-methyladenine glycosylase
VNERRFGRSFYNRPTLVVARDLLGQRLVRVLTPKELTKLSLDDYPGEGCVILSGLITEVEAYSGAEDAASHASNGPTPRNAPMFGPPGHAYVYLIYGMHWMFNVVAHQNAPGAVLIRAILPETGLELMQRLRGGVPDHLLTDGPARLAKALAIEDSLNGVDLCHRPDIYIESGRPVRDGAVVRGPRVGVTGDALALSRPWRLRVNSRELSPPHSSAQP